MSELKYVTQDTFDADVIHSAEPVLVDVTAVWCAPCRMLEPIVKEVAETWQDKMKVVKLDADQNPGAVEPVWHPGHPDPDVLQGWKTAGAHDGFPVEGETGGEDIAASVNKNRLQSLFFICA